MRKGAPWDILEYWLEIRNKWIGQQRRHSKNRYRIRLAMDFEEQNIQNIFFFYFTFDLDQPLWIDGL